MTIAYTRECQHRWHRASMVPVFGHHRGANRDDPVVLASHLVAKDQAPEPGQVAGIGTVNRELGELVVHGRPVMLE
jgi:hypothetical protein